jgi:hypothetical protein
MSCEHCTDPDGLPCFPIYGAGPHTVYEVPGVGLGHSQPLPREQWPSNYREDPAAPGQGVWWCSHCGDGKPKDAP